MTTTNTNLEKRDYDFDAKELTVALDINEAIKSEIIFILRDAIIHANTQGREKNFMANVLYYLHQQNLSRIELVFAGYLIPAMVHEHAELLKQTEE